MTSTPLHDLSATQLLAHYRARALSPVQVLDAVLARIAACEPQVQATYACDPEAALAAARASEQRWARGAPLGALDGVPVTIKDNIATRGVATPLGSAATALVPAAADAPAAARLREAGAVFVAKTTMPDYGLLAAAPSSFHPLTRNPWDLRCTTGGSSAGAGAAAAAGYGPLHLGTDIGGSVRIPASFCGVFGMKPSQGRVPVAPPAPARVVGPLTRTVADAALLMQVIAQPDARDHLSLPPQPIAWQGLARSLRGLRLGLWLEPAAPWRVDTEVRDAVLAAARVFEQAGAIVEPLADWTDQEMYLGVARFFSMRSRMDLAALPPDRAARAAAYVHKAADYAGTLSAEQVFGAFQQLQALQAATVQATERHDFVLSPVSPVLPFAAEATHSGGETRMKDTHFTTVFNQSGQPAASVPCGHARNGLPIGLQIVGRRFDDLGVLQLAQAYEALRPALRPWPQPAMQRREALA